jgi:superfamily I DNA/RNA helicase
MQIVLTPSQKKTLWDENNNPISRGFVKLTARPGTGKTHTLTHYCIDLTQTWQANHSPWQGVGILSYTNVAKREIEQRIAHMEVGYELLAYPHYIGTLDSFINNYIFLPFGSRIMMCTERPVLIGEPFSNGKSINQTKKSARGGIGYFDSIYYSYHSSYGLDEKLFLIGAQKETQSNGSVSYYDSLAQIKLNSWIKVDGNYGTYSQQVIDEKQKRFNDGYATQADANYFAYKLLKKYEDIRSMIINRFPTLLIDEAQDMTEIQHAIVDILCKPGGERLESCVLIGDDAQAIYEWNTARPDLFTNKLGFENKQLTETFRCSKNVCDLLNKLDNTHPLEPAGKNKAYSDNIKTNDWGAGSNNEIKIIIEEFIEHTSKKTPHDNSNSFLSVAVLARSKKLASHAVSAYLDLAENDFAHFATFSDKSTKDLLRIIYYSKDVTHNLHKAFKAYETYWRNKHELKSNETAILSIGETLFSGKDYSIGEYRQGVFESIKRLRSLTTEVVNVSDFKGDSLIALTAKGFPDIEKNIADCASFISRNNGDTALSALFADASDERMPHIVEASNGQVVHVSMGTIHSVKGETYDGVLYFSKDMTEFCKDVCPANSRGKRTRLWSDIVEHDILKCESKRLLYVALSRASQTLWLAGSTGFISAIE